MTSTYWPQTNLAENHRFAPPRDQSYGRDGFSSDPKNFRGGNEHENIEGPGKYKNGKYKNNQNLKTNPTAAKTSSYQANGLITPKGKFDPNQTIFIENLPSKMTEKRVRQMLNILTENGSQLMKIKYCKNADDSLFLGKVFAQIESLAVLKRAFRILQGIIFFEKSSNSGEILDEDTIPLECSISQTNLDNKTDEDREVEELLEARKNDKNNNSSEKLVAYTDQPVLHELYEFLKNFDQEYKQLVRNEKAKEEKRLKRRLRIEHEISAINQIGDEEELVCIGDIADFKTKNANLQRRRDNQDYQMPQNFNKVRSKSPRSKPIYRPGRGNNNIPPSKDNRASRYDHDRSDMRSRESYRDPRRKSEYQKQREIEEDNRRKRREYLNKLANWEERERRKAKEWDAEKEREKAKRAEIESEAKRLYKFFKEYRDIIMDTKYYNYKKYSERWKKYSVEREADDKDREIERKELKDLKASFESQGQSNPTACVKKIVKEAESVWIPIISPLPHPGQKSDKRKDFRKSKNYAENDYLNPTTNSWQNLPFDSSSSESDKMSDDDDDQQQPVTPPMNSSDEERIYASQRQEYLEKEFDYRKKSSKNSYDRSRNNGELNQSTQISERRMQGLTDEKIRLEFKAGFKKAVGGQSRNLDRKYDKIIDGGDREDSDDNVVKELQKFNAKTKRRNSEGKEKKLREKSPKQSKNTYNKHQETFQPTVSKNFVEEYTLKKLQNQEGSIDMDIEEDTAIPLIPALENDQLDSNEVQNHFGGDPRNNTKLSNGWSKIFDDDDEDTAPKLSKLPPATFLSSKIDFQDQNNFEMAKAQIRNATIDNGTKTNRNTMTVEEAIAAEKKRLEDREARRLKRERDRDDRRRRSRSKSGSRSRERDRRRNRSRSKSTSRSKSRSSRQREKEKPHSYRNGHCDRTNVQLPRKRGMNLQDPDAFNSLSTRRGKSIFSDPKDFFRRSDTRSNKNPRSRARSLSTDSNTSQSSSSSYSSSSNSDRSLPSKKKKQNGSHNNTNSSSNPNLSKEAKKQLADKIIKSIPKTTTELFKYDLSWHFLTQNLLKHRLNNWVSDNIKKLLGPQEKDLINVILKHLAAHKSAEELVDEIDGILLQDTHNFVVKLWRLVFYETEARKVGLIIDF